jgi:hypothetical protein
MKLSKTPEPRGLAIISESRKRNKNHESKQKNNWEEKKKTIKTAHQRP